MDDEENKGEAPSASDEGGKEEIVTPDPPPSQDEQKKTDDDKPEEEEKNPIKKELKKVGEKKSKFTKRERLNFEKKKIDEKLTEIDKEEGVEPSIEEGDDAPVTVGMLKKRDKESAKRTAQDLADEIEDEDERKLVKHYLKSISTGNAKDDLKLARNAVNSLKNAQITEEAERKRNPKGQGTSPGAPTKHEKAFQPTEQERVFMNPPYNLTKEDILKTRQAELSKK